MSHDKAFVSALRRHVETTLEEWGLDGEVLADYTVAVCEQMTLGDTSQSEAALEARESLETYLIAVYEETDRIDSFVEQIIKVWLGECEPPWGNVDSEMTDPKTFLHSLFPDRDLATLDDILSTCDGDLGVPVCRYFMQGQCFRADCHFSHDLSSTTCRYWLSGGCIKGNQCEFLHSYDPKRLADHQQKGPSQPDTSRKLSSKREEFPQLGAGTSIVLPTPPPPTHGDGVVAWSRNTDMATWVKQKRLQELFPTLPSESIQEVLASQKGNYSGCLSWLKGCYPNAYQPPAPSVPASTQQKATALPRLDRANNSGSTQWAETGKVVTRAYREVRDEAIYHARCRNKLFEAATQAYVRGDKLAARELSRQGRYHQDMMSQLHTEAALSIFSNRNLGNKADSAKVIDLHGLHVKEALEVLAHILAHGEECRWGHMYVITGTGHHSVQGRARLLPADMNDDTLLDTPFGYQEETLSYMLADQHKFRAHPDYLQSVQKGSIKAWMRQQLVEWIIEVSTAYRSTCVSLAVNLLDRYMSIVKVTPNRLQCVGAAAMLIASKLRDEYPLRSATIAECADGAFTEEHLKAQEHLILAQLGWTLQAVTADELLEQSLGYLNFSGPSMAKLREYALTLLDICHVGYEYLCYEPSVMAAGSLLIGLEMLGYQEVAAVASTLLQRMAISWTRFQECQELMRRHFQQLVAEQGASEASVVATAARNYAMACRKDDRTSPVSVMDTQDVFQSTMDLDSYRTA